MICNTIGLTADSYQSIYVTGGAEVSEVYGSIRYNDLIFLKTQTMTVDTPLMYDSYPGVLTDYTILGNSYQDGVPDPEHPVEVQCVGDLVTSGEHAGEYVIPVMVSDGTNTQTYPIYLSEPLRRIGDYADEIDFKAGTVTRRIREVVLTGNEQWFVSIDRYYFPLTVYTSLSSYGLCTHFKSGAGTAYSDSFILGTNAVFGVKNWFPTLQDFVQFLKAQHTAGTPITVYYPITPITEQITLPIIPTINGQNTLSVGTTLQPSSMSITGHIKPATP